jgi:hypothetical protein
MTGRIPYDGLEAVEGEAHGWGRSSPPPKRPSRAGLGAPSPTAPPPTDAMRVTNTSFYEQRRARSPKNGHTA